MLLLSISLIVSSLCWGGSSAARAQAAACSNEALRTGASARLPDCRAYELVTPPGSDGRLLTGQTTVQYPYDQFPVPLFSPFRDSFLYMTFGTALPEVEGPNGTYDLYAAERTLGGWQTVRRLTPSGEQSVLPNIGGASADHRYVFVHVKPLASTSGGSLAAAGNTDYLGGPDGSFEPVGVGDLGVERLAQGRYISPGGKHVIFTTGGDWCAPSCPVLRLEPDAAPTGTPAVYDREADGDTRVISLLPDDVQLADGQAAHYQGAAADGSVVAFSVGGTLYVRVENMVTRKVTDGQFVFAGISADGMWLYYLSGGDIFRFDTSTAAATRVTESGDAQIVNISDDGSHVYFVSPSLLDGVEGTSGQPNLYVWRGAEEEAGYIATVAPSDLQRTSGEAAGYPALTNWTTWAVTPDRQKSVGPGGNSSRTTPDGSVLVFESKAPLAAQPTNGHTEIYRYDDADPSLTCVSCDPLGGPATGDARLQALEVAKPWIALHNVSDDGDRVFFETPEALAEGDVNGVNDIYQWRAPQAGESAPLLALISTGESPEFPPLIPGPENAPRPNIMLGLSPQGNDVTFIALERLVPEAPGGGSPAIYDARINGGFSGPASVAPCAGFEFCRASTGPVASMLPIEDASRVGSRRTKPRRHRCRRFHHKGKAAKHKACHRRNSKGGSR